MPSACLGVTEAAVSARQISPRTVLLWPAGTGSTTRVMGEARSAMDEVARMASALSSGVRRFRY